MAGIFGISSMKKNDTVTSLGFITTSKFHTDYFSNLKWADQQTDEVKVKTRE